MGKDNASLSGHKASAAQVAPLPSSVKTVVTAAESYGASAVPTKLYSGLRPLPELPVASRPIRVAIFRARWALEAFGLVRIDVPAAETLARGRPGFLSGYFG